MSLFSSLFVMITIIFFLGSVCSEFLCVPLPKFVYTPCLYTYKGKKIRVLLYCLLVPWHRVSHWNSPFRPSLPASSWDYPDSTLQWLVISTYDHSKFFICALGIQTQALIFTYQVLYQLRYLPAPDCSLVCIYLWIYSDLMNIFTEKHLETINHMRNTNTWRQTDRWRNTWEDRECVRTLVFRDDLKLKHSEHTNVPAPKHNTIHKI